MKRFSIFIILCLLFTATSPKSVVSAHSIPIFKNDTIRSTTRYSVVIMQGNTDSASDCVAFENALELSGNGYSLISRFGWQENNPIPDSSYVTASQMSQMHFSHIAYYSGHGGKSLNGITKPILNYRLDGSSLNTIDVASLFGVWGENWQNTCTIPSNANLQVIVLASCSQLDSSIVKYYARILKASNVRTIIGYHDTAPSLGDDTIATNFINQANSGHNVLSAWINANPYQNWAVLVITDDLNDDQQTVYLPGFSNATYEQPSSSATVYRYASFLSAPRQENTRSLQSNLQSEIQSLPLTICLYPQSTDSRSETSTQDYCRERNWSASSLADDDSLIISLLTSQFNQDMNSVISTQYFVTQEEVDADFGLVSDSRVVVERTYNYYDTFNGIKIADSFISASIDGNGINRISSQKKNIISTGQSVAQINIHNNKSVQPISIEEAQNAIHSEHPYIANSKLYNISLAYAPDENGNHLLCYEFMFSNGFYYVDVIDGKVFCP